MTTDPAPGVLTNAPSSDLSVPAESWGGDVGIEINNGLPVYPVPPQDGGVTEEIFGVEVKDPWRSLEDQDSEVTKKYVEEQNKLSVPYLNRHPLRKELEAAVEQCYNHETMTCPELQADGFYYWKFNPGTAPRDVFVRSKNLERDFGVPPSLDGEGPEVFFDLNEEEDLALYAHSFSASGRLWCAVLQESGSDWLRLRVYDTVSKKQFERSVGGAKFTFGATWIGDRGFIYKRVIEYDTSDDSFEPKAEGEFGMYYHQVGTHQSADVLLWRAPKGVFQFIGKPLILTSDAKEESGKRAWFMLDVYRNTSPQTEVLIVEIPGGTAGPGGLIIPPLVLEERKWVSKGYTGITNYIGTLPDDTHLFTSFADGASTGHIISLTASAYDACAPDAAIAYSEVVPANPEGYQLQHAYLTGDQVLVLMYLKHACAFVVFADAQTGEILGSSDPKGTRGDAEVAAGTQVPVPEEEVQKQVLTEDRVVIPQHASISSLSSRSDANDFYFLVDTYVAPPYVLRGEVVRKESGAKEVVISSINDAHSAPQETLVCSQVFYPSHDGVKIPMFVCHAHDLDFTKPNPTLVHAYGGFCSPTLPHFNPMFASFMRNLRGIIAVAGIRGGGEYGKDWHQAAIGIKRWVAWDDFAWAAKYLQAEGLTTPQLTAIYGTSNGGLLVSAAMVRNPSLYSVVFPDVAITDLLRYHKFTLGRIWMDEYGSPEEADNVPILHSTSPLHNVDGSEDVQYPGVLVTTADHDTRVVPGHSLKFLAELQTKKRFNHSTILGRIYENAGHELGTKTTARKVEEAVDRLVYALYNFEK
ncbi:hypothetical protein IAT38_005520 [Cryptococcus sp. DSM 104549]